MAVGMGRAWWWEGASGCDGLLVVCCQMIAWARAAIGQCRGETWRRRLGRNGESAGNCGIRSCTAGVWRCGSGRMAVDVALWRCSGTKLISSLFVSSFPVCLVLPYDIARVFELRKQLSNAVKQVLCKRVDEEKLTFVHHRILV